LWERGEEWLARKEQSVTFPFVVMIWTLSFFFFSTRITLARRIILYAKKRNKNEFLEQGQSKRYTIVCVLIDAKDKYAGDKHRWPDNATVSSKSTSHTTRKYERVIRTRSFSFSLSFSLSLSLSLSLSYWRVWEGEVYSLPIRYSGSGREGNSRRNKVRCCWEAWVAVRALVGKSCPALLGEVGPCGWVASPLPRLLSRFLCN